MAQGDKAAESLDGPPLDTTKDYYAAMHTSQGLILLELYADKSPGTVRNFVNLAEGKKPWQDPKTKKPIKKNYFDGLIFHRVIPEFMIQGGDPLGSGMGGPGFTIKDEFDPSLTFNTDDVLLAMANTGRPDTGGAQFFITDKGAHPTHLNYKHTIFGRAIQGGDVVNKIANLPRGANDRPTDPPVIQKLQIIRVPKGTAKESIVWKDLIQAPAAQAEAPVVEGKKALEGKKGELRKKEEMAVKQRASIKDRKPAAGGPEILDLSSEEVAPTPTPEKAETP
ncbi:peptidylprolyl isomerase [Candidatus Poribacteria bacterium]|nr:peptidylprolyl isomerase [Candidatus Poribacteria bacterium]